LVFEVRCSEYYCCAILHSNCEQSSSGVTWSENISDLTKTLKDDKVITIQSDSFESPETEGEVGRNVIMDHYVKIHDISFKETELRCQAGVLVDSILFLS